MKTFSDRLAFALETELYILTLKNLTECEKIKLAIALCKKALGILRKYLLNYFFGSLEEEITFFRQIKPIFYSKYIYYISIYNYHIKLPTGSDEIVKAYISSQLEDLKNFFDRNQSFYQYYRSGSNHLDSFYFTRGNLDVYSELEDFQGDELFSTSHEYKISKIIANEQFQEFLMLKCKGINGYCGQVQESPVIWTGNQTDLVELLYALVESGCLNNGNIQIKSAMLFFQSIFKVDLKYYYHKFTDISNRKKERTVFLDKLKDCLTKKLDSKNELNEQPLKRIRFS
ncbi:MAG: RteC domain-containing protein [Bacteroidota bacterium]